MKLKDYRILHRYTQEEMCDLLVMSRPKYAQIENGIGLGRLKLDQAIILCNLFNITLDELTQSLELPFNGKIKEQLDRNRLSKFGVTNEQN